MSQDCWKITVSITTKALTKLLAISLLVGLSSQDTSMYNSLADADRTGLLAVFKVSVLGLMPVRMSAYNQGMELHN